MHADQDICHFVSVFNIQIFKLNVFNSNNNNNNDNNNNNNNNNK